MEGGRSHVGLLVMVVVAIGILAVMEAESYSDNCSGSALCGTQVSKSDCTAAFNRYDDGTVYSQYTSRVAGHCTAIFRCDGSYESKTGAQLKQLFLHIYTDQPCGRCGSHAFDNCETTLNYCGSCKDVN